MKSSTDASEIEFDYAELRSLIDRNADGILVVDNLGTVQFANQAAFALFGRDDRQLVGRRLGLPFAAGETTTIDIIKQDGSAVEVEMRVVETNWNGHQALLASLRDISERRELEEQLRHSQKLEAMGQLTGGVAHDFNNLLTPITGTLDLLQRRGAGDERTQRQIAGALASAERARTLVQRLLAFARRQPLQPAGVDIGNLVKGIAELVASTSGPKIKVDVDLATGASVAFADANQLEMAILNLAVNARDAMPEGGKLKISVSKVRIGPQHKSHLPPGDFVRLAVADTGDGMDDATLARAIEPFFSTKGIGQGTGLGLSMVHGLTRQLGGALTLDSTPGAGTTAELWLRAAPSATVVTERHALEDDGARCGTALLVDDEDLVRASTAEMLADIGYEVVEAPSAERAIELISDGLEVDLLITDHLMPGMNGTELVRMLKDSWPGLPVLIVSGYAEHQGIDPSLPRLTKPFRRRDLVAAIAASTESP